MKKIYLFFIITILSLLNLNIVFADNVDLDTYTTNNYVYEYYIDVYGNTVQRNTRTYIGDIDDYQKVAPEIDGYVCINVRVNTKNLSYTPENVDFKSKLYADLSRFNKDGDYVLFIYAKDTTNSGYPDNTKLEQKVTVIYYNNLTGKKLDTVEYTEYIGSNFSLSPSINKTFDNTRYTFVSSSPKRNDDDDTEIFVSLEDSDNIISLYYTVGNSKSTYLTVYHYDVDTNKLIDEEIVTDVKIGDTYNYNYKAIGGYNFVSSTPNTTTFGSTIKIDITNNNKDNVIYCYYRKNAINDDTTTWFNNNNQYYVSPSDTYNLDSSYVGSNTSKKGISINTLPYYTIATGYTDNYFRPNDNLTRGEAAQMFYNISSNKSNGSYNSYYKDLNSSDPSYTAIYYLTSNNLMKGYADNTVRPNNTITRAEFITLATTISGYDNTTTTKTYTDVSSTDWFYNSVKAGSALNLISGYSDGTFKPNGNISRAEAVKVIDLIVGRNLEYQYIYKDINFDDVSENDWYYPYIKMSIGISN